MHVKYIGEDKYVGPKFKRKLAIKHGEVRKVHAKHPDNGYILEGEHGKGYFGWIPENQIQEI